MGKRKRRRAYRNSGYSSGGASTRSSILKSWQPRSLSAASDIDLNLKLLRDRSADLARNSPLGQAAISTSARSVIGSGLRCFPRPRYKTLGITADAAREWSRRVSEEFDLWACSADVDFNRRNNFADLQYVAYESYLVDGDAFVIFRRRPPTPRNPYTLRLQLLEANRISNPGDGSAMSVAPWAVESRAANGNRIINGIEVDDDGELAAIYVSNRVPNDLIGRDVLTEWIRIVARGASGYPNFLQIAHDVRPGMFRGVPYLAPVIESLKQLSRYTTAELSSAIVRSFYSLFFVQPLSNFDINDILARGEHDDSPIVDPTEYSLGPGTINALPRGVDVRTVDSSKQSFFDQFVTSLSKQIGAALGLPFEVLLKSFNASYSASRAALLQANDEFKQRRAWFVRDFCRPVYLQFLAEAVASGRVRAAGFFDDPLIRAAWSDAEWFGVSMISLDPLKEINASRLRVESGVSTRRREAMEMGGADFEENVEQLAHERRLIEEMMADDKILERGGA